VRERTVVTRFDATCGRSGQRRAAAAANNEPKVVQAQGGSLRAVIIGRFQMVANLRVSAADHLYEPLNKAPWAEQTDVIKASAVVDVLITARVGTLIAVSGVTGDAGVEWR
jgi:hypothetical protein